MFVVGVHIFEELLFGPFGFGLFNWIGFSFTDLEVLIISFIFIFIIYNIFIYLNFKIILLF